MRLPSNVYSAHNYIKIDSAKLSLDTSITSFSAKNRSKPITLFVTSTSTTNIMNHCAVFYESYCHQPTTYTPLQRGLPDTCIEVEIALQARKPIRRMICPIDRRDRVC